MHRGITRSRHGWNMCCELCPAVLSLSWLRVVKSEEFTRLCYFERMSNAIALAFAQIPDLSDSYMLGLALDGFVRRHIPSDDFDGRSPMQLDAFARAIELVLREAIVVKAALSAI